MRFGFIAKHRGVWPTRWMCETLDVSHGGFYEWLRRPQCERARMDLQLVWRWDQSEPFGATLPNDDPWSRWRIESAQHMR